MTKDIDDKDLEIWKTVVSVQMHFNDLELRIRNFAILSLGATLTVAGYSLRVGNNVVLMGKDVPFASIALTIGTIVWLCFWFMDRHWYHRLLLGSVYHGIDIETRYAKMRPSLSLSASIKKQSPNELFGRELRSKHRLDIFYWIVAIVLLVAALALISVSFAVFVAIISIAIGLIYLFFGMGFLKKENAVSSGS
ncbi:hypothetical protein D1823_13285 [Ruegeria sp. AD91A]|uniref:hypothetical protein n=1 Tax=Ruegeria sp. AD91A TaxID=2293862 RepID=UPI000E4D9E43|nr:hypothetical protein [Ruegeria sp. AD91A]AXT27462.1 hypothetical protein D1823_13285 [Ruegeria sp. AD91A]